MTDNFFIFAGISDELPDANEIQNSVDIRTNASTSTNDSSSVKPPEFSKLAIKIQNIRNIIIHLEDLIKQTNTTDEQHGFAKKVVNKVKGGFKQVKDKVKGGFKQVKDKVKVGIDKVKDKIGKIKDNIGSGGGGSGGGGYGYRDNYHRRDYNRPTSSGYSGGSGVSPTFLWVLLGLGIAGIVGTLLYFVIKR